MDRILAELSLTVSLDEIRRAPKTLSALLKGSSEAVMQVCTKSFLIAQVFKFLDYTSVIKESIDLEADVVQFFKLALASKDVTADQASVIAYSIYQILKYSKQDVVPVELFQNLFPLAL